MGGAIVGLIWVAVVGLVLVSKISKSMKGFQENRPTGDSEDGWQERGQSTPVVRRRPPATVDELLGQLRQGIEQATQPAARPVPQPVPQPVPAPVRRKAVVKMKAPTAPAPLSEDVGASFDRVIEAEQRQAQAILTESLAGAFPKARALTKQVTRGGRRTIGLSVKGQSALRQGILLSEVLGPPRAFDV